MKIIESNIIFILLDGDTDSRVAIFFVEKFTQTYKKNSTFPRPGSFFSFYFYFSLILSPNGTARFKQYKQLIVY